jgi:hypothetical protein
MKDDARTRYDKANTVGLYLKLNRTTDADILARLAAVPSKQGYIKALIRADLSKSKPQ